jgi:hypothetical protein
MLDKLPAFARHFALLVLAAALTVAGAEVVPALQDQGGVAAVVGALLTALIAYLTPLTRQYGVGSGS